MGDDDEFEKNYDLTILPVKKTSSGIKQLRKVSPILPDISTGACAAVISTPKSGKGNLIMNLLLNSNMFRDAFQDVYVFSSTSKSDQTCKRLHDAFPGSVFDHFDDRKLQAIIDHQDALPEEERGPIAIIVDDMVGIKPNSLFFKLSCSYRHHSVALLLYSCQRLKQLPPIVRSNLTNAWVGTVSPTELGRLSEEFAEDFGGEENFARHYRTAVPERYNFLYIDRDRYPPKLYKNFETCLYSGEN
jgi:hypothetical protein